MQGSQRNGSRTARHAIIASGSFRPPAERRNMAHGQTTSPGFWLVAVWCACSALAATAHAQKPPRYSGMLAGGQRIAGEKLADWHHPDAKPRLDNQALLDPG